MSERSGAVSIPVIPRISEKPRPHRGERPSEYRRSICKLFAFFQYDGIFQRMLKMHLIMKIFLPIFITVAYFSIC